MSCLTLLLLDSDMHDRSLVLLVVLGALLLVLPMVLQTVAWAAEPEELFPLGRVTDKDVQAQWQVRDEAMRKQVEVWNRGESLRVRSVPVELWASTPLPGDVQRVLFTFSPRMAGLVPGEGARPYPDVELAFADATGRTLATHHHELRQPMEYETFGGLYDVPPGATTAKVTIVHEGKAGILDLKPISLRRATPENVATFDAAVQERLSRPMFDRYTTRVGSDLDPLAVQVTLHLDQAHAQASDDSPGTSPDRPLKTFAAAVGKAVEHVNRGEATRVLVQPGVYRVMDTLTLTQWTDAGRNTLLVIDGAQPEGVVLSGAQAWEPQSWELVDAQRRIYRHDWPHDWGLQASGYYVSRDPRMHRREFVAIGSQPLLPVLLERYRYTDKTGTIYDAVGMAVEDADAKEDAQAQTYAYQGFAGLDALEPGHFAAAQLGPGDADYDGHPYPDSLLIRLPDGMTHLEEPVQVGINPQLLDVQHKSRFMLRNLTVQHFASWPNDRPNAAISVGAWDHGPVPESDWRLENCRFVENGGYGLNMNWVQRFDFIDCTFTRNGLAGATMWWNAFGRFRNTDFVNNQWRGRQSRFAGGGAGGLALAMYQVEFEDCRFDDNYGWGLRADHTSTDLVYRRCTFNRNTRGTFHEVAAGPVTFVESQLIGNDGLGVQLLNVNDVTFERCVIADNGEAQLSFYNNPSRPGNFRFVRTTPPDQLPKGTPNINNFQLRDNIIASRRGPDSLLIQRFRRGGSMEVYAEMLRNEYHASNNRYWNPDSEQMFEIVVEGQGYREYTLVDLPAFKGYTGEEQGSTWGPVDLATPGQ